MRVLLDHPFILTGKWCTWKAIGTNPVAQKVMWIFLQVTDRVCGWRKRRKGKYQVCNLLSSFIALNRGYSIIDGLFIKMVIKSWTREGEVLLTFSPLILAGLLYLPCSIKSISQPATIHSM